MLTKAYIYFIRLTLLENDINCICRNGKDISFSKHQFPQANDKDLSKEFIKNMGLCHDNVCFTQIFLNMFPIYQCIGNSRNICRKFIQCSAFIFALIQQIYHCTFCCLTTSYVVYALV